MKTLANLVDLAERRAKKDTDGNGVAVKRVREKHIMFSYSSSDEMVEQWKVEIRKEKEGVEDIKVEHYGTEIAHIEYRFGEARLVSHYGESMSDAQALNWLSSYYVLNESFTYRPVNGGFIMIGADE